METIPATIEEDSYDELLSTELILNATEGSARVKIIGQKQDHGSLVGQYHHNFVPYTRI